MLPSELPRTTLGTDQSSRKDFFYELPLTTLGSGNDNKNWASFARRLAPAPPTHDGALARAEAERAAASELNAAARALSDFAVDCAASCLWVAWLRLGWP